MNGIGEVIIIGILLWAGFHLYQGYRRGAAGDDGRRICPACGTAGEPATRTRGSLVMEIILWLCLIVPGVIYSTWRLTTRYETCPACGQPGMIPLSSPNGQRLVEQFAKT